ncbi:hypothetical protein [Galactobacter valiniphilus]|uniref:hypothetical protein n=1 Tax=Galactobacter valiniphilus TaxID=2676122 RepID=UPI003734CD2D
MSSSPLSPSRLSRYVATEQGVYGLILVSGLIASAGGLGASAGRVLLFVAVTVIVFWLAHVYASVVAGHGRWDAAGKPKPLGVTIRESVREARGMLISSVFPMLALFLGVLGLLPDPASFWLALWTSVAALACLGYLSYRRLGASTPARLVGAVATASFGLVIILAKVLVSH